MGIVGGRGTERQAKWKLKQTLPISFGAKSRKIVL